MTLRIESMSASASVWAEARDFLNALEMAKGVGRIVSGRYQAHVPQKLQVYEGKYVRIIESVSQTPGQMESASDAMKIHGMVGLSFGANPRTEPEALGVARASRMDSNGVPKSVMTKRTSLPTLLASGLRKPGSLPRRAAASSFATISTPLRGLESSGSEPMVELAEVGGVAAGSGMCKSLAWMRRALGISWGRECTGGTRVGR